MGEEAITEEEERLLALLESSHTFPCVFTFKLIYRSEAGVEERLVKTISSAAGVEDAVAPTQRRESAAGRFTSLTLDLPVEDAKDVLQLYRVIREQEEVVSYF
jgi:putative lipoic acid-binding regulatory protein